jgi:hypothetical protein
MGKGSSKQANKANMSNQPVSTETVEYDFHM